MTEHFVTLQNGVKMPLLGLGVYKTTRQEEMDSAVKDAWEAGYRGIDTAQMYENEAELGTALRRWAFPREEYFLTSKVNNGNQGYDNTLRSFEESLEKLQAGYLDLFLVHWPGQQKHRLQETWRALEKLYREGNVRAIGVCNCLPRHVEWIEESCEVSPMVNQIEHHPLNPQTELVRWSREHGLQPESWAPLIRGNFDLPQLRELSEKYGKTPAQIILRWNVQENLVVIPKSVHRERIFENAAIFDFNLAEEDMALLNQMDQRATTSFDLETFDF